MTRAVTHPSGGVQTAAAPLRLDSTVNDVLRHPAFQDFGRLIVPWDDQRGGPTRLRDIESLLRTTATSPRGPCLVP